MKLSVLRFIKNSILAGIPFSRTIYDATPVQLLDVTPNKNIFNIPACLQNTYYVNFELNSRQTEIINNYIKQENEDFEILPISFFDCPPIAVDKKNIISVNMYNVDNFVYTHLNNKADNIITRRSSKLRKLGSIISIIKKTGIGFDTTILNQLQEYKNVTMCDVKTYFINKKTGEKGTMVLDYVSNIDFIDPINVYKIARGNINYNTSEYNSHASVSSYNDKLDFSIYYDKKDEYTYKLSDEFISLHKRKYSRNGVYDEVFFDESFLNTTVVSPFNNVDYNFYYNDLSFKNFYNIFYFPNDINIFVKFWKNI